MASDGGTITTQAIAAAKSVDGYRLMASERNGEIFEAVYVSEKAEITEVDVKSASVERDPGIGDRKMKTYYLSLVAADVCLAQCIEMCEIVLALVLLCWRASKSGRFGASKSGIGNGL